MCGIAGFLGDYDRSLLDKMSRIIAHRGPDDEGIFFQAEEGVGLAHRRLSIIDQLDEPQADPTALNAYFISKLARENDIKAWQSGAGGDDIFTGYRRHYALMLEKYWSWLPV
jgi:asparagine synthetase B (glutamine-hydrolysing)